MTPFIHTIDSILPFREKQNRTGSQVSAVILGQGMTAWLGLQVFLVASVVPAFNVVSLRLTWVVIMSFFLTPENCFQILKHNFIHHQLLFFDEENAKHVYMDTM